MARNSAAKLDRSQDDFESSRLEGTMALHGPGESEVLMEVAEQIGLITQETRDQLARVFPDYQDFITAKYNREIRGGADQETAFRRAFKMLDRIRYEQRLDGDGRIEDPKGRFIETLGNVLRFKLDKKSGTKGRTELRVAATQLNEIDSLDAAEDHQRALLAERRGVRAERSAELTDRESDIENVGNQIIEVEERFSGMEMDRRWDEYNTASENADRVAPTLYGYLGDGTELNGAQMRERAESLDAVGELNEVMNDDGEIWNAINRSRDLQQNIIDADQGIGELEDQVDAAREELREMEEGREAEGEELPRRSNLEVRMAEQELMEAETRLREAQSARNDLLDDLDESDRECGDLVQALHDRIMGVDLRELEEVCPGISQVLVDFHNQYENSVATDAPTHESYADWLHQGPFSELRIDFINVLSARLEHNIANDLDVEGREYMRRRARFERLGVDPDAAIEYDREFAAWLSDKMNIVQETVLGVPGERPGVLEFWEEETALADEALEGMIEQIGEFYQYLVDSDLDAIEAFAPGARALVDTYVRGTADLLLEDPITGEMLRDFLDGRHDEFRTEFQALLALRQIELQEEANRLGDEIEALDAEISLIVVDSPYNEQIRNAKLKSLEKLGEKRDELDGEITALEAVITALEADQTRLTGDRDSLAQQIEDLRNKLEQEPSTDEIDSARGAVANAQTAVDEHVETALTAGQAMDIFTPDDLAGKTDDQIEDLKRDLHNFHLAKKIMRFRPGTVLTKGSVEKRFEEMEREFNPAGLSDRVLDPADPRDTPKKRAQVMMVLVTLAKDSLLDEIDKTKDGGENAYNARLRTLKRELSKAKKTLKDLENGEWDNIRAEIARVTPLLEAKQAELDDVELQLGENNSMVSRKRDERNEIDGQIREIQAMKNSDWVISQTYPKFDKVAHRKTERSVVDAKKDFEAFQKAEEYFAGDGPGEVAALYEDYRLTAGTTVEGLALADVRFGDLGKLEQRVRSLNNQVNSKSRQRNADQDEIKDLEKRRDAASDQVEALKSLKTNSVNLVKRMIELAENLETLARLEVHPVNLTAARIGQLKDRLKFMEPGDAKFTATTLLTVVRELDTCRDALNMDILQDDFDKKMPDVQDAIKDAEQGLKDSEEARDATRNLSDASAAKRLLETMIGVRFGEDLTLEEKGKLASLELADKVDLMQVDKDYAELARMANADLYDVVADVAFKQKLIDFKFKIGEDEVQPFKDMKPEDFADWATIEKHFNSGRLNLDNGFYLLAGLKRLNPSTDSIQAVRVEKKLKELLAKEMGVEKRMDEAGINSIVNEAFEDQMEMAESRLGSFIDLESSKRSEWTYYKVYELNTRFKALKEKRRLGQISDEQFKDDLDDLVEEAEDHDVLDRVSFSASTFMSRFWNSPYSQWVRDRAADVGRYSGAKALRVAQGTALSGVYGLTALMQTSLMAPTYGLYRGAKRALNNTWLFVSSAFFGFRRNWELAKQRTGEDWGAVKGYVGNKASWVMSGMKKSYTDSWNKTSFEIKDYADKSRVNMEELDARTKKYKEKGTVQAAEVSGGKVVDLSSYKKKIEELDAMNKKEKKKADDEARKDDESGSLNTAAAVA